MGGKKNLLSSHPTPLKSFRIYNNSAAVIYIFQNKNKTKTNSIPCICIDMFVFFSVADYTHLHNIYLCCSRLLKLSVFLLVLSFSFQYI